jgi:hypothetical protein
MRCSAASTSTQPLIATESRMGILCRESDMGVLCQYEVRPATPFICEAAKKWPTATTEWIVNSSLLDREPDDGQRR